MKTYTSIRPIASLFLALVACALTALQTQAEPQTQPKPQVAKVSSIEGNASFVDPKTGEKVQITLETEIPAGATIQTEPGAQVDLFLGRNTGVVRVTGNTSVKIEQLDSSNNGSETVTTTVLRVEKGQILASVNKLSKASSYKVELPDSTVKVTEGQFQASYTPEAAPGQAGGSVVNVVSGRGEIVTGSSSRSLKAGKAYSVGSGSNAGSIAYATINPADVAAIGQAVSDAVSSGSRVAGNTAANNSNTGEGNSQNQNQQQNQNQNQNNNNNNNNNVGPASLPLNNTSGSELSPTVAS